ncbi:MAG: N-acetyltransferase [Gammaproteobacteria bacterium]|nr:N-acetyltransferase [Gammaproteobacteria bacterium]
MSALNSLSSTFRQLGALNGLLYLVARVLNHLSPRCNLLKYYLVAQPVSASPRLSGSRGNSIVVRLIERSDPALQQIGRPVKTLEQRFTQGSICLGAFKDAELAGYLWLHFSTYPEDEVRCNFKPEPTHASAWDFDVFVAPKHRLGYTFPRLWDAADALLRARGVRWSMSRISAFNPASLTSHARMGLKMLGSALYLVVFRVQLTLATLPPYIHLSVTERSCPNIVVRAPDDQG